MRGKRTEVDYLNGYIVRNCPYPDENVPVNVAVVKIMDETESGQDKISPDNFNNPVFDRFN